MTTGLYEFRVCPPPSRAMRAALLPCGEGTDWAGEYREFVRVLRDLRVRRLRKYQRSQRCITWRRLKSVTTQLEMELA